MATVKTEHLERFATSAQGQLLLGELLRRLVYCWVPNRIATRNFLSDTANNLSGWDGQVQLNATASEPEHRSLWELSTQDARRAKILRDIKKSFNRTLPSGWDRAQTTYVAVTLRKLQDIPALELEIANLKGNTWGNVKVIDAPALAQWIEMCPAVEAWCADRLQIGMGVFGISLETFWRRWSSNHKPPISPALLTAGRPSNFMDGVFKPAQKKVLTLLTDSADETAAYLYAYLKQSPDKEAASAVLANCLVVSSMEAARALALQPVRENELTVTVLLPPANGEAFNLMNAGYYVVNAIGRAARGAQTTAIKRALRREFADALASSMNLPPDEAEWAARACGASVTVWSVWNRHQESALGRPPAWCEPLQLTATLPAVVASAWDESFESDKRVLETLSDDKYSVFSRNALQHMHSDPPLIERVGNVLSVVAPTVAFALTARGISQDLLRALDKSIDAVFSAIDPESVGAWDKTPSVPLEAAKLPHSEWLRDGLLDAVLRISAFQEVLDAEQIAHAFGGCQAFVDGVVEKIARFRDEPRFFAALASNLPAMAEAAPDPFVEALEQALQGSGSALAPLFQDKGIFGPVHYAGLLAALECLAWEPKYLLQAATLLARLAKYEVNTQVVNQPSNSLRAIFLAWDPSTSASLAQRMDVLRALTVGFPDVAWRLARALLPKFSDMTFGTHEPTWKDFGRSTRERPTPQTAEIAFQAYAGFALELSEQDPSRQLALIREYPLLSPEYRSSLLGQLGHSATNTTLLPSIRDAVWSEIREITNKHRRFTNAAWAMALRDVEALEAIGELFHPKSSVQEVQWLFDDYLPDLPEAGEDINAASKKAESLRNEAMERILSDGLGAVDELFEKARQFHLVAQHAAISIESTATLIALLDRWFARLAKRDEVGIQVLCAARYARDGEPWTRALLSAASSRNWPDWALGQCLANYPDSPAARDAVNAIPAVAQARYWSTRDAYLRSESRELNDSIAAQLIAHGRAVELVNQPFRNLSARTALDVMKAAVDELGKSPQPTALLGYNVKKNLEWLREQPTVRQDEVADVEHSYLPILLAELADGEQLAFHKTMSENPEAFVSLLCEAYRPASQAEIENRETTTSKAEASRAIVAWRVLRAWRSPPGRSGANKIDFRNLMKWVSSARKLAREVDRLAVADQYIGAVLLHTPTNIDGSWPLLTVAKAVEEIGSKEVDNGLAMEVVNSHGVTTRGVLDGGEQEHAEAETWVRRAKSLPEQYPRTKKLFRQIADMWTQTAKDFDQSAAQRRLRS